MPDNRPGDTALLAEYAAVPLSHLALMDMLARAGLSGRERFFMDFIGADLSESLTARRFLLRLKAARAPECPEIWNMHDTIRTEVSVVDVVQDKARVTIRLLCRTGGAAGMFVDLEMPDWATQDIMRSAGALGKRGRADPQELFGMEFPAEVGIDRRGTLGIRKVLYSAAQMKRNRRLHLSRRDEHCREMRCSCARCHIGLDRCRLACRAVTQDRQQQHKGAARNDNT